ncbi:FRG domain-containing protein [Paenibacillus macerans]|uniref:FRG domain-containing protein n=1 Tax=Paenibacillus macerans TaxID=44252 RepID=UPI003D312B7F
MGYSQEWLHILNLVQEFSSKRGIVFFRGHPNSNFKLHSGLFREPLITLEDFLVSEQVRYNHFKTLGHLDHGGMASWSLLYLMQHYGVKTRLLDWSESFAAALFFAYTKWDPLTNPEACVWMLDPGALNIQAMGVQHLIDPITNGDYEEFLRTDKSFADYSIALFPPKNSKRMTVQQGVFTLQGNSTKPLEAEFNGELMKTGELVKIPLGIGLIDDIRSYLLQAGVNYYTLFPDLDGLARKINDPFLVPPGISRFLNTVTNKINHS